MPKMQNKINLEEFKKICKKEPDIYMRKGAIYLTRILIKFRNLMPHHITVFWILIGLVGALLFLRGNYVSSLIGASLLLFALFLDQVDGQIARYKIHFKRKVLPERKADILDWVGTWGIALVTFVCITLDFYYNTPTLLSKKSILIFGFLAIFGYSMKEFLPLKFKAEQKKSVETSRKTSKMYRTWRKIFVEYPYEVLFIFAVLGFVEIFLVWSALSYNILWLVKFGYELSM